MTAKTQADRCERATGNPRVVSHVSAVFFAIVFLIGQLLPVAAGGSEAWMEICSEAGVYLVQIDQGGDEPDAECMRCPLCVVRTGEMLLLPGSGNNSALNSQFTLASYSDLSAIVPARSEEIIYYSRGPPLSSDENPRRSTWV